MANTLEPFLQCVRTSLDAALCLRTQPSQNVERHNQPEVETRGSKEFLLTPLQIWRNPNEGVLIEATINSVRVSVKIDTHGDSLEDMLLDKFQKFLVSRAERFIILRRKPLEGYHVSFLITNKNMESMYKEKILDFVQAFLVDIGRDVSSSKIDVNARARKIATAFKKGF